MRVAHLTSVHGWDDARILHRECVTLAKAGHEVVLICAVAPVHHVLGVEIRAVGRERSRLGRLVFTVPAVTWAAARSGATIIHIHDPELIPSGFLLKLIGRMVVYDAHEDLALQLEGKHWIPHWAKSGFRFVAGGLLGLAGRAFDGIIAATPAIAKTFPACKTVQVLNLPRPETLKSLEPSPYGTRRNTAIYIGGISKSRGAHTMIDAVSLVSPDFNLRLAMAGKFQPPELETELKHHEGWCRVDWLGWLDRTEIAGALDQARIGLVVLQPLPAFVAAWPVKLFEYMAAGIPVVASDFPTWRGWVEEAGCGLLVDPSHPEEIAEAITELLADPNRSEKMGEAGRRFVVECMSWESQEQSLLGMYEKLSGKPSR